MNESTGPIDDSLRLANMPVSMLSQDSDELLQEPEEEDDTSNMLPDVAVSSASASSGSSSSSSKYRSYIAVAVLCFINLLNYMDRFTVAGVLLDVQHYYDINNQLAGLIQTSFIVSYMLLSPVFGYLGDRYNRKYIMTFGIFFWSSITLASSFIPRNMFGVFLLLRGCVGIGEASYSTIAPTIIADLYAKDQRSKMLAVFYFAIPVGSGLGYIVGSNVAAAFGHWQWALRVTPILGAICLILIVFLIKDPPRGESEGGTNLHATRYIDDLRHLIHTPSFVWSSIGFTCVAFVTGALALWAPAYIDYSIRSRGDYQEFAFISLIFGIITCAAGFIGVGAGSVIARRYKKVNPRADPLVCAFGLITCAPFLYIALVVAQYSFVGTCIAIFLGETLLCLNWAIVADILLYCVVPTRRSTAEAFQILVSHLFGDAGSPYLIGLISDALRGERDAALPAVQFQTFQYALYSCVFVSVLGGGAFLACALYVEEDKKKADKAIADSQLVIVDSDEDVNSDDEMLVPGSNKVDDAKHSFRRSHVTT